MPTSSPLTVRLPNALQNSAAPVAFLGLTLLAALVMQHVFGWAPCPLCIVQRLTAIGLALALGVYAAASSSTAKDYALTAGSLITGAGLLAAGSHLYLLYAPSAGSCGPGLALAVSRLVEALPGADWLLAGAGACEDTRYAVLGLPLAAWSAGAHVFALGLALWQRAKQ